MKARLLDNGKLVIKSESIEESYILEMWVEKNHNKKIVDSINIDLIYK